MSGPFPPPPRRLRSPIEWLEARTLFAAGSYYAIHMVDSVTGRGVPQVDLVMTDGTRYTTDSGGTVSFNRAGYLNVADTFVVESYGYALPSGTSFTVTPTLGGSTTVQLARSEIAQRLYRQSGENRFTQTVNVGGTSPISNPNLDNASIYGQDSALTAVYKGKVYEFWGDTGYDTNDDGNQDGANYHTTGATINLPANGGLDPSVAEQLTYFTNSDGKSPKMMFPNSTFGYGSNPIWASSPMTTYDSSGNEKLVIGYSAINGDGSAAEKGFGVWNDSTQQFDKVGTYPTTSLINPGQNAVLTSFGGVNYYVIPNGNAFIRVKDDYADITNINSYQTYTPLVPGTTYSTTDAFGSNSLVATDINHDGSGNVLWTWAANTKPAGGLILTNLAGRGLVPWAQDPFNFIDADKANSHISFSTSALAYNDYLKAWTLIGQQTFGSSFIGEVWYATAPSITGPWNLTRKVQTDTRANGANDPYTFYNVVQHPYYDSNGPYLYYAGTYTNYLVSGGLMGQYFANNNLTDYVYKAGNGPIDQTYGAKSPNSTLISNVDNFSVKWKGNIAFGAAGSYQFRVTTDAGAKLIVHGTTLVDQLAGTTQASYTGTITATANASWAIELDYASLTSTAAAVKLEWLVPGSTTWVDVPSSALSHPADQPIDNYNTVMYRLDLTDSRLNALTTGTGLTAQYFNNNDLTGYVSTAAGQIVNGSWAAGASPATGVDGTNYSIRYTGLIQPSYAQTYTFFLTSAGGARLWVNGQFLVDHYADHTATTDSATIALAAYQRYDVRVEYQNTTLAGQAKLEWSSTSQARQVVPASALYASPSGLLVTYFDDQNLATPKVTESSPTVNLTLPLSNAGPDAANVVNDGVWSARWTGLLRPDYTGTYTFTTSSDDGIRVWVNGAKVIDNWTNHGTTVNTGSISLTAGQLYDLIVEYYNSLYTAVAQLSWSNAGQTGGVSTIVPETNLFATLVTPAAPLVVTDSAAYLKLDADGLRVDVWSNGTGTGTPAHQVPLPLITAMSYAGSAGNGALTVDFSNGNPLWSGGLNYTGGTGGANTLAIIGTGGNDAIKVGAASVIVTAAFGSATVGYTGATAISIAGGAGADTLTQTAQPAGGATVTFAGSSADTLAISAGTFTLPMPATGGGPVDWPIGTLTVAAGARVTLPTATAATDRTVLDVTQLTLSGTLDLGGNAMVFRGGDLATVWTALRSGYAAGNWTGTGLTSSAASADATHLLAIGAITNGSLYTTFAGQPVAPADVLVRTTYYGDTNLDGTVDVADYTRLDAGFVGHLSGWANGDVNYDGLIDGSDYTLTDNAFNTQATTLAPAAAVASATVAAVVSTPKAKAAAARPPANSPAIVAAWTSADAPVWSATSIVDDAGRRRSGKSKLE